jgi:hypothetical protein
VRDYLWYTARRGALAVLLGLGLAAVLLTGVQQAPQRATLVYTSAAPAGAVGWHLWGR